MSRLRAPSNSQESRRALAREPEAFARNTEIPWDSRAAVRAAAHGELHEDLLLQGVGRLGGIAVIASITCALYALEAGFSEGGFSHPTASLGLVLGALGLSVLLGAVTRLRGVRPQSVRDLGYAYLIALCLLLSLLRYQGGPDAQMLGHVSPTVIPILAFAALVPASPKTALVASLAAAATDPLALAFSGHAVSLREILSSIASPFFAAFVAHYIARVVHQLSEGIERARRIESYQLVERLGSGGMAEVWRAEHRMLARPAAVKWIRPEKLLAHGPIAAERLVKLFLREARTTAQLSSPNTIHIYDFGITREGAFYYVMELLDGIDLQELVERFGPQSPERAAHFLRQVCRSLAEAHERDFVHRDVKPANVFTCRYGGEADFVKVLDFGLVLDRHPTQEELEDEERFVGTPAILAPEMVRFQAPVDARADIYAVGCVGYWLLTGRHVFEAQTRADMLVMHAHQKPVTPSKRMGREIHPELEALLMNCLEKSPDRRPQSARELAEELEALTFPLAWTTERAELWWRSNKPTERQEPVEPREPPPRVSLEPRRILGPGESPWV